MRYKNLGRIGVLVSELCLGTKTFGEGWGFGGIDDTQADAILGAAMDAGINFVDTAVVYSEGYSEIVFGRALAKSGRRDQVVLATKGFGRTGTGANNTGLSHYHLVRACEASLKRLGTDRIDLYKVQGFDAETPIEEVMRGLDLLVKSGKVLYLGFCNWTPAC
jgi:aryl-alcohol dehydrogenase-like predicted oxidoreductase